MKSANKILSRLDDSHLAWQPHPGAKTAGWLIGHLAVTGDFGRRLCGASPQCPREWRAAFNPGTQPSLETADYPSMEALRTSYMDVYSDLCTAAENADQALLSMPNPFEPARADFPTSGDFVSYLLSSHLAYHLGQLSAWHASSGAGNDD